MEEAVTLAVQPVQVVQSAVLDQEPEVQPGQSEAGQLEPPHLLQSSQFMEV